MDCRAAQARLISFHFGALQADVRTLLEAHLQGCATCLRSHLAVKRAIDEGLRTQRQPARPERGLGHALGAGLIGAALALLVSAGLGLRRPEPAPSLATPATLPAPRASCPAPAPAGATFI